MWNWFEYAINGWYCVLVAQTYLAIRLTPKKLYLTVSHRKFLANFGAYERIGISGSFFVNVLCYKHLRNQKLRLRRMSSNYPRKLAGSICGDFFDKSFKMYDIASTARSGWHTLWRKEQRCPAAKSLAPKIFHLSVSHQNILANLG